MRNEDVFWTDAREAYNDPKLKNGIVGLFAPGNGRGFSGCGSAPGSPLRAPGWNLARRSTGPHQLILLGLISPDMRRESSCCCCWCCCTDINKSLESREISRNTDLARSLSLEKIEFSFSFSSRFSRF